MSSASARSLPGQGDLINRRLALGLLLSLFAHALLLALQFGVPGGLPAVTRMFVRLAPTVADAAPPPALDDAATLAPPAPAVALPVPPIGGMRLVDPLPRPAPVHPLKRPPAAKRVSPVLKRKVPDPLTKRVIAEESKPDSAFLVAQPAPEPAIDMSSDPSAVREGTEQGSGAAANKADAEQVRLAQQREADQRRAEVQLAQQRDSEMRRQREVEEQARLTQQREAEVRRQQQAEEQARMARQRDEEVLRQQQAEEQARLAQQRTEELRRQRQADELAARQRAEQEQRQAELQKRAAEQLAARRTAQAADVPAPATAGPSGVAQSGGLPGGAGSGNGNGAVPRPVSGSDLASRARDMLRGIDVLKGSPPSREAGADPQQARRLIFGSAEREVQVRLYIDSFRQKIERNGTLNGAQLPGDRVRIDPVVSVAIRSDGSVEDVLIVRSSGHPGLDAALRRIVRVNARYSAFPPNVAARYDVIEIRRIWTFADGLRLLEEVH